MSNYFKDISLSWDQSITTFVSLLQFSGQCRLDSLWILRCLPSRKRTQLQGWRYCRQALLLRLRLFPLYSQFSPAFLL